MGLLATYEEEMFSFFIKYIGFENSFSNESDTVQIYLSTQTFKLEEIQITHLNTSLGSVVRRQTG